MKVGLVCLRGAINIASWRGNADSIEAALRRAGVDVVRIDIARERLSFMFKAKQFVLCNVFRRGYTRHREPSMLRHYGRLVEAAAAAHDVDVILGLTVMPVAQLDSKIPVVFWNDSPFAGMLDWYPEFSFMPQRSVMHGHAMEIEGHRRSALAIYSSQWAADIAIRDYGAVPERTAIVEFGPNIAVTWDRGYVAERVPARLAMPYRLVWVGVDWERKGGDVAVAVARRLYEDGFPVELTIAGVRPPRGVAALPFTNVVGFLNKPEITRLIDSATFLLLPSRADLSPIVFNEASALGVPVISRPIGGIPAIVARGKNGMLFPAETPITEIARYIRSTVADPAAYRELALNAYAEYESRLNWDVAARRLVTLLAPLAARRPVLGTPVAVR